MFTRLATGTALDNVIYFFACCIVVGIFCCFCSIRSLVYVDEASLLAILFSLNLLTFCFGFAESTKKK